MPISCLLLSCSAVCQLPRCAETAPTHAPRDWDLRIGQKNKNHCVGAFLCLFTYLASKQSSSWRLGRMEKRKGNQALRL